MGRALLRAPSGGEYFATHNPGRGNQKICDVAQGSSEDVDAAVKAAAKALPGWQAVGAHGRARYLYAIARHLQKHSRLFSVLESLDNGKPIRESRDIDIPLVARLIALADSFDAMSSNRTYRKRLSRGGQPC